MSDSLIHIANRINGKFGVDFLEGREHFVVPVVMITVGVHQGSNGPLYYPPEELRASQLFWNGKPILVNHSQDEYHRSVLASDPKIITKQKIGTLFNTSFDGHRLRAEAWIEKKRVGKVSDRVENAIVSNRVMEVSTGLVADYVPANGTYNGKAYTAVARNIRPDHLAVLPDTQGACSVADGCGLACCNQSSGIPMFTPDYCKTIGHVPMFTPSKGKASVPMFQPQETPLATPTMNFERPAKPSQEPAGSEGRAISGEAPLVAPKMF